MSVDWFYLIQVQLKEFVMCYTFEILIGVDFDEIRGDEVLFGQRNIRFIFSSAADARAKTRFDSRGP